MLAVMILVARRGAMPEYPALLTSIARGQTAPFAAHAPAFGVSMAAALVCTRHAVLSPARRVPGHRPGLRHPACP